MLCLRSGLYLSRRELWAAGAPRAPPNLPQGEKFASLDIPGYIQTSNFYIHGYPKMTTQSKKVLVTIPLPLLKRLDARAEKENRNRSAELCRQLDLGLKTRTPAATAARRVQP